MAGGARPSAVTALVVACVFATATAVGCAAKPKDVNPSFPLTPERAQEDLDRIAKAPQPLRRPIVILGGFADPGFGGLVVGNDLRHYLPPDAKIVTVSFTFCDSFAACRDRVIAAVDREFPTGDRNETSEVDVIGLSMGGLVGRYCAAPDAPGRRLRVHTLFTASSPLSGALRAERWPHLLTMQKDMLPGSDFYRRLDDAERAVGGAGYELVPYVRLGDTVVGPQYAAPNGRTAWWVPNPPGELAHVGAMTDPRILSDVLRRLRGEKPWTTQPAAPLPAPSSGAS